MASRYWVGGGSSSNWNATGNTNWAATSGGAGNASVPGVSDDVFFDAASPSPSVLSAGISVQSVSFAGYTGTFTHNANITLTVSTGVTFAAGMTYTFGSVTSRITMGGSLTTAGKTLPRLDTVASGTLTLQDALICDRIGVEGVSSTFTANNFNVSMRRFGILSGGRTVNMGNGTWTILDGASGGFFATTANTLNCGASTLRFPACANEPTFTPADYTYNAVQCDSPQPGLTAGVRFSDIAESHYGILTIGAGRTIIFANGISLEVVVFTAHGAPLSPITLRRPDDLDFPWSLEVVGSADIAYVRVEGSQASGAAFPATPIPGGVDLGNNTGWVFPAAGIPGSGGTASLGTKETFRLG